MSYRRSHQGKRDLAGQMDIQGRWLALAANHHTLAEMGLSMPGPFPNTLHRDRKDRKLTLEQVADALEKQEGRSVVSYSRLAKIEKGEPCRDHVKEALGRFYGKSVSDIWLRFAETPDAATEAVVA